MKLRNVLFVMMLLLAPACGTDPPADNNGGTNNGNGGDSCTAGERTCQDERTVATCVRSQDGETRTITVRCLDTEQCTDGDCVPLPRDCDDLCTPGQTQCTREGGVETCADHDQNGCVEFGGATACGEGEVCDPADGLCKEGMCVDNCATPGETACEEGLVTTCGQSPAGCMEYGPAKECPEGMRCVGNDCSDANCENECEPNTSVCTPEGQIRECQMGAEGCYVLTAATSCGAGETCRRGECVSETDCQDMCLAGEKVCIGNEIASCEPDANGCLAFTDPQPCPGGDTCQRSDGNVSCQPPAQAGKVVINEVFYDAVGEDLRGSGDDAESPVFIELYGPAGLDISGYEIELVNGSTGQPYASATLPADAKIDGFGFAVVAMDTPDVFIGLILPAFVTNVYFVLTGYASGQDALQNGPDAVVLRDGAGVRVDAVAYGAVEPARFVGEGTCNSVNDCDAAPEATAGRSIGRVMDGSDTDNNSNDFVTFYPTPGLPNSDLLINEIYFDQPGVDDGTETFVELVAPITGWEDMPLDGYVLHAVNGFDGSDYIFSGQLPGIEMSLSALNDPGPSDGYVVICNIDTAGASLLNVCSVPFEGVDFQNGPDNFVLTYRGRTIDAVGYGSFGANHTFAGEGSPAPFSVSNAGKSLGRWPMSDPSQLLDTNDNATDFHLVDPTPGGENPLP